MKDIKTARLRLDEARAAFDNAIDKMNAFANATHSLDVLDEKQAIYKIARRLIEKYNDWATTPDGPDVNEYLHCDVYQVELVKSTGKKVIHIDGFCYFNDEEYQLVQGTGCYMDIDGTQCTDKAAELFEETKQYQCTVSREEVLEYYRQCTYLPYDEVTQDTPCGFYIN